MSNLTDNTAALNLLLEKANNLPEAGEDMPEVELATPQISVAETGKITASITQEAGKVAGGTKTATLEQSTLAAKTYTPGTTDQTIRAYLYLTGNQIIKGDVNLIPANIVSGVTIFDVEGIAEVGDGSSEAEDAILSNTLTGEYVNDRITYLTSYAFAFRSGVTAFKFPNVTSMGGWVFTNIPSANRTELPKLKTIGNVQSFNNNKLLKSVDIGFTETVKAQTFLSCPALKVIILRTESVAVLDNVNAFNSSSLASGGVGCSVLVPRNLIADYPDATNWSAIYGYGNCTFLAVEDYTKDGTTSGEPDWDKIEMELMV